MFGIITVEFDELCEVINFRGVAGTPGNFSLKKPPKNTKIRIYLGILWCKNFWSIVNLVFLDRANIFIQEYTLFEPIILT
jgi:hypothetical protein